MSTNVARIGPKKVTERRARDWISGFLVLGVLLGLLGPIMVAWQYHRGVAPQLIGLHFLALSAGYVVGTVSAQRILSHSAIRTITVAGCSAAVLSLILLAFLPPPISPAWRLLGLALVGVSAGTVATGLFFALEEKFLNEPAGTTNRAGILFGLGCLLSTLMMGLTYFAGSVFIDTALLAIVPAIFVALYGLTSYQPALKRRPSAAANPVRTTLMEMRSVPAVLFSLLLFFQFGNEWAVAGWLPLYVIHRLGTNPSWAMFALALYFFALMTGRLLAQRLLLTMSHRKLLFSSTVMALAGFLVLTLANLFTIVCLGVAMIGAGFAAIYPLVAEKLDARFSYAPGFYNGIFSIAIVGAMAAPWTLGYLAAGFGMASVMLIPALGSLIVVFLSLLITLEAHVMGVQSTPEVRRKAAGSA